MNQTIAQRKALHRTIERRSSPALPRDRFALSTVPPTAERDGYVAAGMGRTLPANASPEFKRGFRNRRQEIDCWESVGAQA